MFSQPRNVGVNHPADPAYWAPSSPLAGLERRGGDAERSFRLAIEDLPNAAADAGIQRAIAEMATRLVTIEPRLIDETVGESLRDIGSLLRLDRAILVELALGGFMSSKLEAGEVASFAELGDVPDQAERDTFLGLGIRSATVVPVATANGAGRSALVFGSTTEREWPAT